MEKRPLNGCRVHRYKLKDDVRESLYDACNEWTSALRKSGQKFMGGNCPNLADLVRQSVALWVVLIRIKGLRGG